ncbi:hypothetical protein [Methanolobus sp. WCC4]
MTKTIRNFLYISFLSQTIAVGSDPDHLKKKKKKNDMSFSSKNRIMQD